MASEANFFSIYRDPAQQTLMLRVDSTIYSLGELEYLEFDLEKNSCALASDTLFEPFKISSEKIEQFAYEFLRTWGSVHKAHLRISPMLESIDYDPQKRHWTLHFESQGPFVEALTSYLNEGESFEDQVGRVQHLIGSIMKCNIIYSEGFSALEQKQKGFLS